MADLDSVVVWSNDLLSAKEAVSKLGLPCMVKVVNGCTHADFSEGHLLKLDFGIAIKKVAACFVSKRPDSGDKTNDIFIPLGYEGKVRIAREDAGSKIYTTLKGLIEDFPRYVQVEDGFSSTEEGSGKPVAVASGAKLELDKAIGTANLYCKFNDRTLLLTTKDKIKFRLLADDTTYTLQEVVDRLHFPQTVRFLDPQFQTVAKADLNGEKCGAISDTLKLSRVTSHEVIVGLLRPSVTPTCGPGNVKKKVQPTLALFPLQASAAVNDIKVKAVADKNDKMYKSTMAKLFPQTVDRTLIQESFYIDLASKVNIHIQKDNHWITVKPTPVKKDPVPTAVVSPPPLPQDRDERKMSPRVKTPPSPKREEIKLSPRDSKSPTKDDGPKSPKDKNAKKNKKEKKEKDKDKKKNSPRASSGSSGRSSPPSSLSLHTEDDLPIAPSTPSPSPPPAPELPMRKVARKPTPSTIEPRPLVSSCDDYVEPLRKQEPSNTSEAKEQEHVYQGLQPGAEEHYDKLQDEGIYDELGPFPGDKEAKNKDKDKDKDKDKKKKGFKFFTGGRKKKQEGSRTSLTDIVTQPAEPPTMPIDKIPDMSSIGKKPKPVGTVRPNSKSLPEKPEKPNEFKAFTVVNLVECLRQCGLPDLAKLCEKEKLDGDFLASLSATDLTKEPFSLNPLHLKKLERIKEGWRPTE
ncbi:uncharacterized protein LOC117326011 [Pecten maximus]|uniref:uncharacterized protein LOC117326011 n=1 Tax=Pecten maximus TaxID=6579 RepID=UPI00145845DF|nr:uncharacterized protein LOC117326011 [Pecten maximus]